jgi:hypothetical protein
MNLAAFKEDSPQPLSLNSASVTTAILKVDFGSRALGTTGKAVKAIIATTIAAIVIPDATT